MPNNTSANRAFKKDQTAASSQKLSLSYSYSGEGRSDKGVSFINYYLEMVHDLLEHGIKQVSTSGEADSGYFVRINNNSNLSIESIQNRLIKKVKA